jgi:hypothetical protein
VENKKAPVLLGSANFRETLQTGGMGDTGLEQGAEVSGKAGRQPESGAKSGALGAREAPFDAELAAVVEAWPKLPAAIKAGILAIVSAANPKSGDHA